MRGLRPGAVLTGLLLAALAAGPAAGDPPGPERLTGMTDAALGHGFALLRECLSIPNDAHYPEQVEANMGWMQDRFAERGFTVLRLATGGRPLLLADRRDAGALGTLLVYLQVDGQPVDPARWSQPDPYQPVLKRPVAGGWEPLPWEALDAPRADWRVFARSAADAKGPAVMLLAALDALAAEDLRLPWRLKVVMDFEEELGSPGLPVAVQRHRGLLAADGLLILDGPMHPSNRPTLVFGARGIATITLKVFGPRAPMHSGHYGNFIPNPAQALAELLAGMKDDAGRVTLPGFYEGVDLDVEDRAELRLGAVDEEALLAGAGVAAPDRVAGSYQTALEYPSLNIRGLSSAWVGEQARTVIPATATAELDLRLVPESDTGHLVGLVREHVARAGYHIIGDREPTDEERLGHPRIASFTASEGYAAFRTPMDSPTGEWLADALERAWGRPPVKLRMWGGSIPISPFVQALGMPAVALPTVQRDNNQHAPDENLRLGNFADGIRSVLAVLTTPLPRPDGEPTP